MAEKEFVEAIQAYHRNTSSDIVPKQVEVSFSIDYYNLV